MLTNEDKVLDALLSAKNVIIFTHSRPDGDALGSSFGLRDFLRACNIKADVLLTENPPSRYIPLCDNPVRKLDKVALDEYDLVVTCDCANHERLACDSKITIENLRQKKFVNIDHHHNNNVGGNIELLNPNSSSNCKIIAELLLSTNKELPQSTLNWLLLGMMTDTGSFRFSNTCGNTLRTAAILLDKGAQLEKIVNQIFLSKPYNQLRFENEMVEKRLHLFCNNRFAIASLPQEMMDAYNFKIKEDEGLIDILRGIDSVIISALVTRVHGGYKVSLRSKDSNYPVRPIAQLWNGGGHDLASGTTMPAEEFNSFDEVEAKLAEVVDSILPKLD